MRIWIHGGSLEEVREMIEKVVGSGDTESGTSLLAETDSSFPQSGLLPAISAAIRREFDLLLIPSFEMFGSKTKLRCLSQICFQQRDQKLLIAGTAKLSDCFRSRFQGCSGAALQQRAAGRMQR